ADALGQSIARMHPREMVHNPVMFVVYAFMIFTGVVTLVPSLFPDITAQHFSRSYFLAITVILFLTVWFSTLSEAIAEAQGKAQAESLRKIQTGTRARKLLPDGRQEWV